MRNLISSSNTEIDPLVLSDVIQEELGTFFCNTMYICDDDVLYTKFLTELSGDGREIVRRASLKLNRLLERDRTENAS